MPYSAAHDAVPPETALLRDTLQAVISLYFWVYSPDGHLAATNSQALVLHQFLSSRYRPETIAAHFQASRAPLYLSTDFGLSWGAVGHYQEDGALLHVYVLGPAIGEDISVAAAARRMRELDIPLDFRASFADYLKQMPLVTPNSMFIYVRMLHYAANGEALLSSDIRSLTQRPALARSAGDAPEAERQRTWLTEQQLLRMVQEGDLDYRRALADAADMSGGVRVNLGNQLRRAQVSGVAFTTLCTRAAIQGGLTPELAYTRGDAYIQSLMECQSAADVIAVNHAMYDDFIHLVRKARLDDRHSAPVRTCRDYIELHVEEEITLATLAARTGYTEYYLSRKFKQETGTSISSYIKFARMEHAKTLLMGSSLSIAEISERLHFCNRTYFATEFRRIVGLTPAEYRKRNRKI